MSPKTPVADSTLSLQLQQFMDEYSFKVMTSSLGKTWTRKKTIVAALELFSLNGISLTPEDIEWCSQHDDLMIPMIVRKMPYSIRENFESLRTQLNILVNTATRVRSSVESGDEGIENIIDDGQTKDDSAIKEQILKESVIQASKQVASLLRCQETWCGSMDKRLFRLSRSAELAEQAQEQLLKVETQLTGFHAKFSEKSKICMMGFAELSTRNVLHSSFANWAGVAVKYKVERQIRKNFEQEMLDKEMMLMKLKERGMQNVKAVLLRKSRDNDESIVYNAFHSWTDEVGSEKREEEERKKLDEIEKQLATFSESKAANAKKFMARAAEENDEAIACMAFAAWSKGVATLKFDNEIAADAQKIEAKLSEFQAKSRKENAKVMNKLGSSTNTSLLVSAVQGWSVWAKDQARSRDLENTMMENEHKFKTLNARQKGTAAKVQTRVNEQAKQNLAIRVLAIWQIECKVNHVDKYYNAKMEGKRKQLQSVQTLFKSFAKQLEEGLGKIDEGGESSGRTSKPSRGEHGSRSRGEHGSRSRGEHSSSSKGDSHGRRRGDNSASLPGI